MKQTWKTYTLTTKRQAIRDLKALVADGVSVSRARKTVGDSMRPTVTSSTIYNWERKLTGKSIQTKGLPVISSKTGLTINKANGNIQPHITSVNLHVPGKGNITLDNNLLRHIAQLAGYTN